MLRGKLKKSSKIITAKGVSENVQRIYEPLADEYREISEIDCGNVAILAGLKVNIYRLLNYKYLEQNYIFRIHQLVICLYQIYRL